MPEKSLRVVITQDQRLLSDVTVHGSQVLVGSGGHCDVRLGPDQLAVEQLRLSFEDGQLFVRALTRLPVVTLRGLPFSSGVITSEDVLGVGHLLIRVIAWQEEAAPRSGHKRLIPVALLAVALVAVALFGQLSQEPDRALHLPEPPASPFTNAEAAPRPPCPELAPASARVAAEELWREAIDHRERAPFSPKNGLEAVRIWSVAGSCFAAAGDKRWADEALTQAGLLRGQLEKSFHVHHVRLSRSIPQKDFALSKVEVAILKGFMAGREHPYATWLDDMDRWLEVTQGTRQTR